MKNPPLPEHTISFHAGKLFIKDTPHTLTESNGKKGWVALHRWTYYENTHGNPPNCHHCQHKLQWENKPRENGVWIKHLDGNKENNAINNLQAVCQWCLPFANNDITHNEHNEALQTYGHLPPAQRPPMTQILVEQWGIPINDVLHNLNLKPIC